MRSHPSPVCPSLGGKGAGDRQDGAKAITAIALLHSLDYFPRVLGYFYY